MKIKIDIFKLFIKKYERDSAKGKENLKRLKAMGINIRDFFNEEFDLSRFSKMIDMSVTDDEDAEETLFYLKLFSKKNEDGNLLSLAQIQGIANCTFYDVDYEFLISKKEDGTYWSDKEVESFYYLVMQFPFEDFKFLTEVRKDGRYWNEKEINIIHKIMLDGEADIDKIKELRTDGRYFDEEELSEIHKVEFWNYTSYYLLNPKSDGTYFTKGEMKKITDLIINENIDAKRLSKIFKTGDLSLID